MLLLAPVVLAFGAPALAAQTGMEWVEGQWRWESNEAGCDSAHDIRVTHGGKYVISSYTFEARRDSSEYRVLDVGPGVIRAQITGEKRLDDAGNAVIWNFVRLSEDAFCWHRADWGPNGCTQPLFRCTVIVPGRHARAKTAAGPPEGRRAPTR